VGGERMLLYVLPHEGPVRAAFVASRRIGGAVVRNRARRQMKEAWRSLSPMITDGFDLVFTARPAVRGTATRDLHREMKVLLGQAEVLRG
jgi:ribonuclease P protein component